MNYDYFVLDMLSKHRPLGIRLMLTAYSQSLFIKANAHFQDARLASRVVDNLFFSYFNKDISHLKPPLRRSLMHELDQFLACNPI